MLCPVKAASKLYSGLFKKAVRDASTIRKAFAFWESNYIKSLSDTINVKKPNISLFLLDYGKRKCVDVAVTFLCKLAINCILH